MPNRTSVSLTPEIVRYTRNAMQMTQLEFGEYLGVEGNTVWRWEAGVHLPVGRKAKEIVKRYKAAVKNAKANGEAVPSDSATAVAEAGGADDA